MAINQEPKRAVLLFGGVIIDHYFVIDRYPRHGQDASITRAFDKIGGCSLNVAVTLKNLGSTPYIVSQIGRDEAGGTIANYLEALGLPVDFVRSIDGRKTGYCLTMVDCDDERTFFTYQGCQGDLDETMIPDPFPSGIGCVYVTGYFLRGVETCRTVLTVLERLAGEGIRPAVIFDPGPLVDTIPGDLLLRMLKRADWIIPNAHEIELLGSVVDAGREPLAALKAIGCRNIVIKHGAAGSVAHAGDRIVRTAGYPVRVSDTTGAGDSFVGGFIHALLQGVSLEDALQWATACGALTTTVEGPHGAFTARDISQFIKLQKEL